MKKLCLKPQGLQSQQEKSKDCLHGKFDYTAAAFYAIGFGYVGF